MMERVNLTKIYCKHIINLPIQLLYANKVFFLKKVELTASNKFVNRKRAKYL
jgi:hypothetical protein